MIYILGGRDYKPAKFKPSFLQATAVIIMCEPSRECTKFGGKAVLWRLTMIYESEPEKKKKKNSDQGIAP
jgi:hypothetical protein